MYKELGTLGLLLYLRMDCRDSKEESKQRRLQFDEFAKQHPKTKLTLLNQLIRDILVTLCKEQKTPAQVEE